MSFPRHLEAGRSGLSSRGVKSALAALLLLVVIMEAASAHTATGRNYIVATVHPIATEAAIEVFREGGNAVDAAVSAALTLGVVDGFNSGIGGGCLILIRSADGKLIAIDGRETAPAAAHKDMYLREGKPVPEASQTGPLAVGTPGALSALALAVEECGSQKLERLLAPGITAARNGFVLDDNYAANIRSCETDLKRFAASKAVYFHADGSPYRSGEVLKQPDLAKTYQSIAEEGIDWFYHGPFAEVVGEWMKEHGGLLRASDFANYRAVLREPLVTTYRDFTVVGFPPPSSGGVHVAQVLNILEPYDLRAIVERNPTQGAHLIVEAFKLAFADRAHWLGDSDFVEVPRGLAAKSYARTLGDKINLEKASTVDSYGTPPNWRQDLFERHTTHIAAADSAGNWVAITATINTTFGSKVIVPGTGLVLNNEMDDFSIYPGLPNAFGLVGAENNAIEPGKRPLSSMSPTIVLNSDGEPILTLGAAGGPKIITQVLLTIIRYLDLDQSLEEAVTGPRIHHQWRPDSVAFEPGLDKEVIIGLKALGHRVEELGSGGRTQAIAVDEQGVFVGISDPRINGRSAGE